ncbi:putative mitochondrion biogenesis protein [Tirmania nivea]|nr:putative mitochondrion biogenesis protein [Tirmania nivea]
MRPLFQRTALLARQFSWREFASVVGRRQQLPARLVCLQWQQLPARPVCLQCQFLLVRRQPYSIGLGSNPPSCAPPSDEKKPADEQKPQERPAENEEPTKDAKPSNSPRVDVTKLPSTIESKRIEISKRISAAMNDLQSTLFVAGKRLNEATGYAGIEQMKKAIEAQEAHVRNSRAEVRAAKEAYQQAINRRSASQREVNELLQRKHAWSPSDLERFTSLYRNDHANEQEEVAAQERLAKAERVADEAQSLLTKNILTRYHEEQIWSDKIRSASTWVTWALMGFNVFLFVIVQLGLEPWRRRRLVGGFEEKVREVIQEETLRSALLRLEHPQKLEPVLEALGVVKGEETVKAAEVVEEQDKITSADAGVIPQAVEDATIPVEEALNVQKPSVRWTEIPFTEAVKQKAVTVKEKVNQLFSEQAISLRQRDLTTVAVGSAAVGAVVTGVITFLWNR